MKLFLVLISLLYTCLAPIPALAEKESTERHTNGNHIEVNIDFSQYMKTLQKSVIENWSVLYNDEHKQFSSIILSKPISLIFEANKQGGILSLKLFKSSGNKTYDKTLIKAIKKSVPLPPFPEGYKESSVTIYFTFDYNAFNHQKNKVFSKK